MSTIKSLEIKNFQRVSSAVIEPSGNVVMVCGQNANGKTSVLDAIEVTFEKFNARVTKRPVKDGAGRADIKITLTDGTQLHQKFLPSGPQLTGTAPDGQKISQKDVDQVISALGVDAAAFITAGEKKQLETLLSIVELPFVPAELDAERKAVFAKRTEVNGYAKRLDAQLQAFLPLPDGLPEEETSVSALVKELNAARETEQRLAFARQRVWNSNSRLEQIRAELAEAETELTAAKAALSECEAEPLLDIDDLQLSIDTAEVTNAQIRVSRERAAVAKNLQVTQQEADQLTAQLAEIDQRKADGLANAEMPIDGLSFDEEGVLYQGVPFSRASGAEQIIVSAAMIIATDPEVRTMVIRNGNVMDTNSLAVLQEMCEDNDFQAFVEFVSDSEDHEFRIVDGELA